MSNKTKNISTDKFLFARQELTTRDLLLLRSGAGLKVYTTSFAALRANTTQLFLPCFVGKTESVTLMMECLPTKQGRNNWVVLARRAAKEVV